MSYDASFGNELGNWIIRQYAIKIEDVESESHPVSIGIKCWNT